MALKGLDKVLKNLDAEVKGVQDRTIGGMLKGGLIIQREAQMRVPVEYGNLRQSAFTRRAQQVSTTSRAIEIGFTAAYAVYVHENLEQKLKGQPRPSGKGVYWGPAGEPKFLQTAITVKTGEFMSAVKSEASIKPGKRG